MKFYTARKIPERPKTAVKKNSDLNGIVDANESCVADKVSDSQSVQLRLKIKKLKAKIGQLEAEAKNQEDMIWKLKSKGSGESEYSSKLRKDLLK